MYKLTIAAVAVAGVAAINTDAKTADIKDRDVSNLSTLNLVETPSQEQIDKVNNYFGNNVNCIDLFQQLIRIRTNINTQVEEYKVIQGRYDKECKFLHESNVFYRRL